MSRYIGVDMLETEIKSIICYAPNEETILLWDALKKGVLERIKHITPADVVEVVRCKDCRLYEKNCERCSTLHKFVSKCDAEWFYCGYGEKKE